MTIILETPRLVLRRQVPADLDDLWALYCDPEITKFIPDAPRTRQEAREELEWHMNGHPRNPDLGLWEFSTLFHLFYKQNRNLIFSFTD